MAMTYELTNSRQKDFGEVAISETPGLLTWGQMQPET